jgi:hypothetical protein
MAAEGDDGTLFASLTEVSVILGKKFTILKFTNEVRT